MKEAAGENKQLAVHSSEISDLSRLPLVQEFDIFGNFSGRRPRWLFEPSGILGVKGYGWGPDSGPLRHA